MNKLFTGCCLLVFIVFATGISAQPLFTEDFESGTANAQWTFFYTDEDIVTAKPMAEAPHVLTTGGNYVGWLQDIDASYTGSAVAINGSDTLTNYSIEADVYCYVNNSGGSAYTGLVVYADTSKHDFYKLRADFDASNRINFSGLRSDPITFLPLFSKDFKGVDNPGIFPTTDGWHKMKIEVRATSTTETSFWCYFDGNLLTGCPVIDTNSTRNTSGSFGLYTFQMDNDGIPGYFDNIIVNSLVTSVDDGNPDIPKGFYLEQNYPNPFNPETRITYQLASSGFTSLSIYDLLGREIKTLVSKDQPAGNYTVSWNGTDELDNTVPSGIYLYTLKTGNMVDGKKMILMK
ncbi:MAG: FlgD immunoglobulin-like domain containing protein [Ignavibacteria bacterium]|nr:FlgD immunoglobulin-like domain containing protein [Ignavibacteria bacterium]